MTKKQVRATGVMATWKRVFAAILKERRRFWLVVLLGALSTGATLIEPIVYREAVNDVTGLFVQHGGHAVASDADAEEDPGGGAATAAVRHPHSRTHVAPRSLQQALRTLLWAVVVLFVVNIVGHLLWWASDNLNVRLSCDVERRYLEGAFTHVLRLPLRFFGERSSTAIVKRMDQTEELTEILNGFSQEILPELISLVGIIIIMLTQSVLLTLVALSVVPVYLWLAWRSSQRLETGLDEYYEEWEDVSTRMQDAVEGIKTVKLSGAEQREVERLRALSDKAYASYTKRSYLVNWYLFWETALTHLVTALVLGVGGYLALVNKLTPGDVVMFVAFIDRLYGPIDTLSTLWVDMQQNAASIARSDRLLKHGKEEPSGQAFSVSAGEVVFDGVRFGYERGHEVLHGVSFTARPGRKTAIVGPSGAGKTTTVDLLLKLFDPWEGEIRIDGQPLRTADPSDVRRSVGMVMADGKVFRGTLAENIRYAAPHATHAEVKAAALAAGLGPTIARLKKGLSAMVGEGGVGLSVGERQRVQIARVLAAKPHVLVLDEATANLDHATELEVRRTLEQIRKEHTVIVVAHRYNMVRDADHVVVLLDGAVAEQGPPHELISRGGWFAEFARSAGDDAA